MSPLPAVERTEILNHDLRIELARLDMMLEQLRAQPSANDGRTAVQGLEARRAKVAEALVRLSA